MSSVLASRYRGVDPGSLDSVEACIPALGFSLKAPFVVDSEAGGSWSPLRSALSQSGSLVCGHPFSRGSESGCGVGHVLFALSGLRNYSGAALCTITCSCGCLAICAFRNRTSGDGGHGVLPGSSEREIRLVTLPHTPGRSRKRTPRHFLKVLGSSGSAAWNLKRELSEIGWLPRHGFEG